MFRLLAIRSVIFPFLRLVWRLLLDRRVSVFTKTIPLMALIYLISPFDLVSDFIPVLGQFDSRIVVVVLRFLVVAAAPADVVADLTIGRKLRDGQRQQGDSEGKTVDAEIRYLDNDDDEDKSDEDEKADDANHGNGRK